MWPQSSRFGVQKNAVFLWLEHLHERQVQIYMFFCLGMRFLATMFSAFGMEVEKAATGSK